MSMLGWMFFTSSGPCSTFQPEGISIETMGIWASNIRFIASQKASRTLKQTLYNVNQIINKSITYWGFETEPEQTIDD